MDQTEWTVLRVDGQSLGTSAQLEQVAQLARAITVSGKRVAIVVSSIQTPGNKSTVHRLIDASSNCLRTKASNYNKPTFISSCSHPRIVSQLERDLVQLIRRSIKDPNLGEDAEAFVAESLRSAREFLAAIEIIGEMSPSSYDTLTSSADSMAAYILTCFLQSSDLPAKLIPTQSLHTPILKPSLDTPLFDTITSSLCTLLSPHLETSTIPVFSGSFPLPHPLSLHTHLPNSQHTSLFASLVTVALSSLSSLPAVLYLLHSHIKGIYTVDPRITPLARKVHELDLHAAVEVCGVSGGTGVGLSSLGVELVCGSGSRVYLSRIGDVVSELNTGVDVEQVVKVVGTRIGSQCQGSPSETKTDSENIVIYKRGVVVVRIDRVLESSGATDTNQDAVKLLMESHRILGHVFSVFDECGVRVYESSSSYKTVTVAVGDESTRGFKRSDSSEDLIAAAAVSPKSNLETAIDKLRDMKSVKVNVHPNKGIVSLISSSRPCAKPQEIGPTELTQKLLGALAGRKIHIEMCSLGVGAAGVSVVVGEEYVTEGVKAVHEAVCRESSK
ncbi:Aspartokinase [Rhizoclosmatium sp. JEL0117]|nr:Aspartokinase [Rhizoclosmatium sp. JEL0117]